VTGNYLAQIVAYGAPNVFVDLVSSGVTSRTIGDGLHLHIGLDVTSFGAPVQFGPNISADRENTVEETKEKVPPFMFVFRMRKIKVSTTGEIESETVTGGYLGKVWNDSEEEELVELKVNGLEEEEGEEGIDLEGLEVEGSEIMTEDGDDEEANCLRDVK